MVGFTRTNRPNIFVPKMAPILAMRRCVPVAVVRRLVGYTSAMIRLVSFQAGVVTAVKIHSMAMTKASEESMYRRNTEMVDTNMAMAGGEEKNMGEEQLIS